MLRERNLLRACWTGAAILGAALLAPATAVAGELTVNLRETDNGVVVELRGIPDITEPQHVITSKTGALLFLPDQTSPVRRIASPAKHRLDFVQVGQAGAKVAVRIVQRKRATGSLGKFMRSEAVPGGIDVIVDDGVPKAAPIVTAAVTPAPAPAREDATSAALARLADVDAEADANAEVTAPAPVRVPAPVAEAPFDSPREIEHDTKAAPPDDTMRTAAAFEDAPPVTPIAPNGRAIGWIALASMCALGSLAIWKIRKRRKPAQPEPLRIVSRVALGPKQQLVWIVAGDRALLVGATDHGISLISELGRIRTDVVPVEFPEASATATVTDPNAGGKIAAFKQKLRVALGDELAGKSDLPAHLELLTADPKWTREGTA